MRSSEPVRELLHISRMTFDLRFGTTYRAGWVNVFASPRSAETEQLRWGYNGGCCCCACARCADPARCTNILQVRAAIIIFLIYFSVTNVPNM